MGPVRVSSIEPCNRWSDWLHAWPRASMVATTPPAYVS